MNLFIAHYDDVIRFAVSASTVPNNYFLRAENPIIPYWELSLSQAEDFLDLIIKQQEHKTAKKKQIEDTFLTPAWVGYKLIRFGQTRIELEIDLDDLRSELHEAIFNVESYCNDKTASKSVFQDALDEIIRDLGL